MESLEVVFRLDAAADLATVHVWIVDAGGEPAIAAAFTARIIAFCEKNRRDGACGGGGATISGRA